MHTVTFYQDDRTAEFNKLVDKTKSEFTNAQVFVEPRQARGALQDGRYIAMADDTVVSGDTTHLLFERIKNIIGEREVDRNQR